MTAASPNRRMRIIFVFMFLLFHFGRKYIIAEFFRNSIGISKNSEEKPSAAHENPGEGGGSPPSAPKPPATGPRACQLNEPIQKLNNPNVRSYKGTNAETK